MSIRERVYRNQSLPAGRFYSLPESIKRNINLGRYKFSGRKVSRYILIDFTSKQRSAGSRKDKHRKKVLDNS